MEGEECEGNPCCIFSITVTANQNPVLLRCELPAGFPHEAAECRIEVDSRIMSREQKAQITKEIQKVSDCLSE